MNEQLRLAWEEYAYPPARRVRMNIDELEALLKSDGEEAIEILPNGEIQIGGKRTDRKPLTMRENLGGEYAA